jgi:hypothetical protein
MILLFQGPLLIISNILLVMYTAFFSALLEVLSSWRYSKLETRSSKVVAIPHVGWWQFTWLALRISVYVVLYTVSYKINFFEG